MKKYDSVFKEQKNLGIIKEVSESSALGETSLYSLATRLWETTKLRTVFDASSKTDGSSLNDWPYKGPFIIYDILLWFHTFAYALATDIDKAFLQISIAKDHPNFLQFLWFDDVFSNELTIAPSRFARIIFGITSSPFLLNGGTSQTCREIRIW